MHSMKQPLIHPHNCLLVSLGIARQLAGMGWRQRRPSHQPHPIKHSRVSVNGTENSHAQYVNTKSN